jgi:hypothetical protein
MTNVGGAASVMMLAGVLIVAVIALLAADLLLYRRDERWLRVHLRLRAGRLGQHIEQKDADSDRGANERR